MFNDFDKDRIMNLSYDMEKEIDLMYQIATFCFKLNSINTSALNWAMAYVEFKSSNEIESVYSTLHDASIELIDNIRSIRPLNIGKLEGLPLRKASIDKLAQRYGHNQTDRLSPSFGIYESTQNRGAKRIYTPILDAKILESQVMEFWSELPKTLSSLPEIFRYHIYFEKLHPYSDGNGRIGRYILEYLLTEHINNVLGKELLYVLPISAMFNARKSEYYDSFNLDDNSLNFYFDICIDMFNTMSKYIDEIIDIQNGWRKAIVNCSTKIDIKKADLIASNFLFKQDVAAKKLGITRQTANIIFEKLNELGLYNITHKKGKTYYFNVEVEQVLYNVFNINK